LNTFIVTNYKRRDEKNVGVLAWISFMQFPTVADYWSKRFLHKNAACRNWIEFLS
jgi:hypothetical protein